MSTQKRRRHRHRTHGTTGGCGQCLFCGEILDVSCLAAVHGALAEGYNVSDRTGSTAYIDMCGIPVPAIVVEPDSDVARAGFQVVFLLCSEECAKAVCLASMLDHILSGNEPPTVAANTVCGLRLTEPGSGIGPQFERAMELLLPMVAEIAPHALNRLTLALGRDLIDPPPRGTGCVPTRQELEWAQRVMGERCAWCLCIF